MPAAVFRPTTATLPASCTAWPSGSLASLRAAGARRGRGGGLLAPVVLRFGVVRVARVAGLDADARADDAARAARGLRVAAPLLRLALRCPGRDRGRLPRTPGLSSRSAATRGKIAVRAASMRARRGNRPLRPRCWVNVATTEARPGLDALAIRGIRRIRGRNEQFRVLGNELWGYTAPALRRGIHERRKLR
jgi:hypothetical protein